MKAIAWHYFIFIFEVSYFRDNEILDPSKIAQYRVMCMVGNRQT